MTVIRKGVIAERPRRVWFKKRFPFAVADNGTEHAVAALAFPQYVFPEYIYKLHVSAVGASENYPWATTEVVLRASHVNISQAVAESATDTPTTLMQTYAPIAANAASGDPAGVAATNVGITGREEVLLADSKDHMFLHRKYECKLGSNSYNTNASKIRYLVECNYSGHGKVENFVDASQPSMLFVGFSTNDAAPNTDVSGSIMGNHTDWDDLYASLIEATDRVLTAGSSAEHVDDPSAFTDSAIQHYQSYGYATADASVVTEDPTDDVDSVGEVNTQVMAADDFIGHVDVTMSARVYQPDHRSILLAP